jgi:beta-xylosidase
LTGSLSALAVASALLAGCDDGATPVEPPPPLDEPPYPPVLRDEFADPFVLADDGQLYAYASNRGGLQGRANVPMATSTDAVTWNLMQDEARPAQLHDAMPALPVWAATEIETDEGIQPGATWAPEVIEVAGRFVLYYTTTHAETLLQCVGVAVGDDARGPFTSEAADPLVCQTNLGGTIDPSPFRAPDGTLYLYYKNEGNRIGVKTRIYGHELTVDGLGFVGDAVELVENDQPWEGSVVEAPTMVERGGVFVLLFSGNGFEWKATWQVSPYAIGYATCGGPLGPCTDAQENPILASTVDPCFSGPGHQTVFARDGQDYLGFHSYHPTRDCRPSELGRFLHVAELSWAGVAPKLAPLE